MTPDVPAQLLRSVLISMEACGHDASRLMRHLRPSAVGRARSSWDELIVLLETFFSQHGVAAAQALMQDLAGRHSSIRVAAELLGSPRLTYLVLLEALQGRQSVVVTSWKGTGAGLSLRLELQRGLRPSLVFFQCCAWFIAAIPRVRGLGDARLATQLLSERALECQIVPPREPELTVAHAEASVKGLAKELFRGQEQAPASRSMPSAQSLQSRFGLTRAEARVVRRLAEGHSIKRIAEEFEVSVETARTHAKRAMQKTDTHRQAELVSLVLHSS